MTERNHEGETMAIHVPRYERVFGLPSRAITITNSERSDAACPRRWWFRHVERLAVPPSSEQRHGQAWHAIQEDVHAWYRDRDAAYPADALDVCPWCRYGAACAYCGDSRLGVLARHRRDLLAAAVGDAPAHTTEDAEHAVETLRRCSEGWFTRYGRGPYREFRVVGVEAQLARAVLDPRTGQPFAPLVSLVVEADGSARLAGTGEASGAIPVPDGCAVKKVRWPWYQVGTLDAILVHRATGAAYVGEWKSSRDPAGLVEGLTVDPQVAGYGWLLDGAIAAGVVPGASRVAGYLYDVASSSYQYDPEPLKAERVPITKENGEPLRQGRGFAYVLGPDGEPVLRVPGLSKNKQRTVPSWRFLAALRSHGFAEAEYDEHLTYLATSVDPRLYVRDWGTLGEEQISRYTAELYGDAVRFAALRKAATRATDDADLHVAVPRVPVCRTGQRCAYRGPCVADGEQAREPYHVGTGIRWDSIKVATRRG